MSKSRKESNTQAIKKALKAEEDAMREKTKPAAKEVKKMSFDQWYASTSSKFNAKVHKKEVIKADFLGRGLSKEEEKSAYDKALELYGIKLS